MADKFESFITDTLNGVLEEHIKTLKTQEE